MSRELNDSRFGLLVLVFVISMLVVITRDSMVNMVVGWDGLGLRSYFLVVYFDNFRSNKRGLITVVSNRIGDVFIIIRVIILVTIGDVSLSSTNVILGLIITLASVTKRAIWPYCV